MSAGAALPTRWVEVRWRCADVARRGEMIRALMEAGAAGVQEVDDELVTHLPDSADLTGAEDVAAAAGAGATLRRTLLGEIDWAARWPTRVGVQRVGRIAVAPPWLAGEIADAEIPIVIEPAMAFGTGEHETTRGALRLMQDVVRAGDVVADLGAGSAVLSIAAARLGAARVAAVELDADALRNAEENVATNGMGGVVTLIQGDATVILPLLAPVRVILANIVSSVILDLAPVMYRALTADGRAVVSGILVEERDATLDALASGGWRLESELSEGEWWSGVIAKP